MDSLYILFGASLAVGFLAIVTFVMANALRRAVDERNKALTELTSVRTAESKQAQEIINRAQQNANQVLTQAEAKSQEIVKTSQIFSDQFTREFQQGLMSVVEEQKKIYQQMAQGAQSESNKVLSNASQQLSQQIMSEMQTFHNGIVEKVASIEQELTRAVGEDYKKVQAELDAYKAQAMKRVDENAVSLVEATTKKVLGKALSKSDHEKLVMEALEEAKKQNVL